MNEPFSFARNVVVHDDVIALRYERGHREASGDDLLVAEAIRRAADLPVVLMGRDLRRRYELDPALILSEREPLIVHTMSELLRVARVRYRSDALHVARTLDRLDPGCVTGFPREAREDVVVLRHAVVLLSRGRGMARLEERVHELASLRRRPVIVYGEAENEPPIGLSAYLRMPPDQVWTARSLPELWEAVACCTLRERGRRIGAADFDTPGLVDPAWEAPLDAAILRLPPSATMLAPWDEARANLLEGFEEPMHGRRRVVVVVAPNVHSEELERGRPLVVRTSDAIASRLERDRNNSQHVAWYFAQLHPELLIEPELGALILRFPDETERAGESVVVAFDRMPFSDRDQRRDRVLMLASRTEASALILYRDGGGLDPELVERLHDGGAVYAHAASLAELEALVLNPGARRAQFRQICAARIAERVERIDAAGLLIYRCRSDRTELSPLDLHLIDGLERDANGGRVIVVGELDELTHHQLGAALLTTEAELDWVLRREADDTARVAALARARECGACVPVGDDALRFEGLTVCIARGREREALARRVAELEEGERQPVVVYGWEDAALSPDTMDTLRQRGTAAATTIAELSGLLSEMRALVHRERVSYDHRFGGALRRRAAVVSRLAMQRLRPAGADMPREQRSSVDALLEELRARTIAANARARFAEKHGLGAPPHESPAGDGVRDRIGLRRRR